MNSNGINIFSKCVLCHAEDVVGFDVHLLQVQVSLLHTQTKCNIAKHKRLLTALSLKLLFIEFR